MSARKTDVSTLARRYASALFDLSLEDKKSASKLKLIEADIANIAKIVEESPQLGRAISSPNVDASEIYKSITTIAKKSKAQALTIDFLKVVAENRRVSLLPAISKQLKNLAHTHRGEIEATVTTAKKLSPKQKKSIEKALSQDSKLSVLLEENLDKKILGGMIINVGSKMLDASVSGNLERIERQLKSSTLENV